MNKEQIEGNKLIAEFMGAYRPPFEQNPYEKTFLYKDGERWMQLDSLKYHTSWDWLMPVVEKISKTHLQNWDGTECTEAIDTCYPVTFNMPDEEGNVMFRFKGHSLQIGKSLIDVTWQAVVEFIQWYNYQTPTK